ncbi:lipoyl(octanoyl) transferase [Synechococcus sp. PROS-7-1]|uniref:lipoyl(octanoyl) transferase LipB n=1 Tax=Synechococcus sp. PROS-7-1 TaxID=1442556 RepID=UPI0016457873|nr:lipoyl(octanoyl) transferase LipB [Synechococcus sp. PROS-7-1]QNI84490.1 lipoyl(octanoyl) transferase [Synechococcus sp. PROS-7-1]
MPRPIGNLETTTDSGTGSAAFLFQPAHLVPFAQAWTWQRCWQERLLKESEGLDSSQAAAVWLLQHPPCYTLGRGASEAHVLFDPDHPPAPLHRIDRGGEVTHHSPGQLVIYPVLDLHRHRMDLHWYLRQLEQVVIDVLAVLGLRGERFPGLTGVWLERCKVAAIGVGCRRWITQHGVALNVCCAMEGFEAVVPCGLTGRAVGRLSDWIPGLSVSEVQPLVCEALAARFGLRWVDSANAAIAEGRGW